MRILVIGAGGVGSAVAPIAARRVLLRAAWSSPTTTPRAPSASSRGSPTRGSSPPASTPRGARRSTALCREHRITHVLNAVDPRFVMPIFDGAFAAGADYMDMAMSLSPPAPGAARTS